jgi:hypothetical protein
MTIVNDDSRVVNKLKTSLTDDARVVIYYVYSAGHWQPYVPNVRPCKPALTLPPGVNAIKKFPSSLKIRPNELEHLSLETLSSHVLEFEGKARANPIGVTFLGKLLVFPANVRDCQLPTLYLIWPHRK